MADITSNGTYYLEFPLIFDVFQFLVIVISLCAGLVLLVVLPTIKSNNFWTIWMLVLFGFVHEFYSVIILLVLKYNASPEIICMDSHVTSMLVTTFILCTILSSAIRTVTKSFLLSLSLWIYVLCTTSFISQWKDDMAFTGLNIELKPSYHFHLTSCGANLYQSSVLLLEYIIIYIPFLLVFVVLRKQQSKKDCQFWNMRLLLVCSSDERCEKCFKQNHMIQIMLLYLCITVYIVRPLFIVYHIVEGGMYYDVLTSIVIMGTYCFLCLETFIGRKTCKVESKYNKTFRI